MFWIINILVLFILQSWTLAAPVAKRMVDLTHIFDNDTLYYPTMKKFEIKVLLNGTFQEKYWLQLEEYSSGIHVGTHMDAPCHFAKGAWTLDQIPLDRFIAPAAVVDIEDKAEENPDYQVTIDDLEEWEEETGQKLNQVVLLIRSGWSKRWGDRERFTGTADFDVTKLHFPGVAPQTAQWLADERDLIGLGTETFSPDYGQANESITHHILLAKNIYFLENVANVDQLPLYGATLYVMPMKIGNGSGAPTRVVATFPDIVYTSVRKSKALHEVIVFS